MVILGFMVMMIILAGLLYLYYRQLDLQKKAKPPEPPPIYEPPSIADLHAECLSNPLQCGIDEVNTTIEGGDIPLYEDIYGFKTNLFNMKKALKEDGTCVDDNCPEIQDLVKRVQDISHEALLDSMDNCKKRLPTDRLRRIVYNSVGDEVAREPTYMLGYRNNFIDYAEEELRKIRDAYGSIVRDENNIAESYTAEEERAIMVSLFGNSYDQFFGERNKAYKEDFLSAFGPSLDVLKAGGVTKCDYFVKECADEDPICHEDAVRKHKIIQKYRPEIVDIQSEDFNTRLEESGLTMTPTGIQLSVTNQQVMEGATDEEKERARKAFAEAQKVSQWWAVDKDGDTFTDDAEYTAYLGGAGGSPGSVSLFAGYDENSDGKISRQEYFNFIENMKCVVEEGGVQCTPLPIET
ncbi:hypothetical protein CL646_04225 [bacterium]|nr:hypothetical protein [bacterium]|tara:strand:+ start:758 stop:1981 length:1224 start_codon:yes stop_codon:yes gene_type:complete